MRRAICILINVVLSVSFLSQTQSSLAAGTASNITGCGGADFRVVSNDNSEAAGGKYCNTTKSVAACGATGRLPGSRVYNYRVDPSLLTPAGERSQSTRTTMKWIMRIPEKFSVTINQGSFSYRSVQSGLFFYGGSTTSSARGTEQSFSNGSGGGTPKTVGKVYQLLMQERYTYIDHQRICYNPTTKKVVGVVSRSDQSYFKQSSTTPIWKRETARDDSDTWEVELRASLSSVPVPKCTKTDSNNIGKRYRQALGRAASDNNRDENRVTLSNTSSWTLGMETPVVGSFTMSAEVGGGKSVTVTFSNMSAGYRRVLCVSKPASTATKFDGDFFNLNFTGSAAAQTSIKPGMIIGVDTFAP